MTMKEVFEVLRESWVIEIGEKSDTHWVISNYGEYFEGGAEVFFDEDGNVIKVQGM